MKIKFFLLACFLLLLLGCQSPQNPTGTAVKVQRVVSGQTLEVVEIGKQPPLIERVRLLGIEAPDLKQQPWGEQSRKHLEELIGEKGQDPQSVVLEFEEEEKDSYGRRLAYVWRNGIFLNEQMLKEGYALSVPRNAIGASTPPSNKYETRLNYAQEWARIMENGIWNPKKPLRSTPAEFRRQNP